MFKRSVGLERNPFDLTADPSFLYLTKSHREALAGLSYAIPARKGFVVLASEAGMGKTTLLVKVLRQMAAGNVKSSFILNPTLSPSEFLEMALLDFGFSDVPASKALKIVRLQQMLLSNHAAGRLSVLIVDEAHKLSTDVLEEIRLLSNFECAEEKLLQIVLAGQTELVDTLDRQDLWQLKQRIAVRLTIEPLSPVEVGEYMQHRWKRAGGVLALPFHVEAIEEIARVSRGVPRVINGVCGNALMAAFADGKPLVTPDHVSSACMELRLLKPEAAKPAPEPCSAPAVTPGLAVPVAAPAAAPAAPPEAAAGASLQTLSRYGAPTKRSWWWIRNWTWSATSEPGTEKI
jgi:general secretion pathway protein A